MVNLIIPTIFLFVLYYANIKKKRRWEYPSSVLLILYLLSVICAYPDVYINDKHRIFTDNYFEASLIFCFLILLFFSPFIAFREDKIEKIVLPSQRTLHLFSIVVCILSIYSVIYFIPITIKSFSVPDIRHARIMMTLEGEHITNNTIFNTIAGTAASFFQIPIILFNIYHILDINKRLRNLLLVSSLSYVFFVFSSFGRDGVVFWMLSFIGISGFFKPFLKRASNQIINRLLFLFLLLAVPFFMTITISRFNEQFFDSIISYIGQGIPNFFLAYEADVPISHGASFPLFRSMLGLPEDVDISFQKYKLEEGGTVLFVFGTFLKDLILSIGLVGTIFLAVVMGFLFKSVIKEKREISFSSLFVYFLYFMIFYQGVFYFRQGNRVGNLVIIVCILLYYLFSIIMNEEGKKCIIIEKSAVSFDL